MGRSGMHKYNNQDHSMLTAMLAVDASGSMDKENVWAVNMEQVYHEVK
jgi:predicted metal-dependent peptidase